MEMETVETADGNGSTWCHSRAVAQSQTALGTVMPGREQTKAPRMLFMASGQSASRERERERDK